MRYIALAIMCIMLAGCATSKQYPYQSLYQECEKDMHRWIHLLYECEEARGSK
jgi:hypothetical protein